MNKKAYLSLLSLVVAGCSYADMSSNKVSGSSSSTNPKSVYERQVSNNVPASRYKIQSAQHESSAAQNKRTAVINPTIGKNNIEANIRKFFSSSDIATMDISVRDMAWAKHSLKYEDSSYTSISPIYRVAIKGNLNWPFPVAAEDVAKAKGKYIELAVSVENGGIVSASMAEE